VPTILVGDEPIEAVVDAQANRVYVVNLADNRLSVIDTATNAEVANIRSSQ